MPERPPVFAPGCRVVFRPDHRSFGRFIVSDQVRDAVVEVAEDIAELAKQYAPRRKNRGRVPPGGSMADRFKVNRMPIQAPYPAGTIKVERNIRAYVEVFNDSPSAAPNEFGGRGGAGNERHRMLGRAGAAFGELKARESL